jgi:Phage integrase family
LGLHHLTHHDLRHLFATRCIESGVDIPTVAKWLGHKDGGVLAMQTYGHLRDKHSEHMARKVIFNDTPILNTPCTIVQKLVDKTVASGKSQVKTVAQAKAAYSYPWWASSEPIEVFWGQVNEPVQIVPLPGYLQSAKTAMGREVFEKELGEPEALLDELTARIGMATIEKLKAKISPPTTVVRAAK